MIIHMHFLDWKGIGAITQALRDEGCMLIAQKHMRMDFEREQAKHTGAQSEGLVEATTVSICNQRLPDDRCERRSVSGSVPNPWRACTDLSGAKRHLHTAPGWP